MNNILHENDKCPICYMGILEIKKSSYPFVDYYLKCDCCDNTFELNE